MSWENAPKEVQKYYEEGPRKAISVVAEAPYVVSVGFDDGITKEYDYSSALTGVLSDIRDPKIFSKVYIDETNSIAWDTSKGHMDFSADSVYIYGKTKEQDPVAD